ncbi:hypothetical protein [Desulfomarina sp.]
MKKRFFLFQDKIEALILKKRAILQGNRLILLDSDLSSPEQTFKLTPAVKVLYCETSRIDPYKLVGKFIPTEVLSKNDVDLLLSSFTYKNQSYRIDIGFLTYI